MDKLDICRVCMEDDAEKFESVFSARADRRIDATTAAVMLVDCTGIEVEQDDGLPEAICNGCLLALLEAYKFRVRCRNTDRKLRKILNIGKTVAKQLPPSAGSLASPETSPQVTPAEAVSEDVPVTVLKSEAPTFADNVTCDQQDQRRDVLKDDDSMHVSQVDDNVQTNADDLATTDCVGQNSSLVKVEAIKQKQPSVSSYEEEYLVEELKECTENERVTGADEDSAQQHEVENNSVDADVDQDEDTEGEAKTDEYIKMEVETLEDEKYEDYEAIDEEQEIIEGTKHSNAFVQAICCCGCPYEFNGMTELKAHSEAVHKVEDESHASSSDLHPCDICWKKHTSMKALNIHKTHRYNKQLRTCSICWLVCPSIRRKKQHEILHKSLPDDFEIDCCGCKQAVLLKQLGFHIDEVHRKQNTEPKSKFICDVCFLDFTSKPELETHQSEPMHNLASSQIKSAPKLPPSDGGMQNVVTSEIDGKHRFVCDVCNKDFSTKGNLKTHRALHDATQKAFRCTLCEKDFSKKSNYNVHMMRTHSAESSFNCLLCSKKFKCSINLKSHMRVHTKDRPFMCAYCMKAFAHLSDKRRHEIVHSGNYPFQCSVCNKPFTRRTLLEKHLQSCRNRISKADTQVFRRRDGSSVMLTASKLCTDKSIMSCDFCEEWFTTLEHLADHHAEVHTQTLDESALETEVEIE